jgi:hypothetical protein
MQAGAITRSTFSRALGAGGGGWRWRSSRLLRRPESRRLVFRVRSRGSDATVQRMSVRGRLGLGRDAAADIAHSTLPVRITAASARN